MGRQHKGRTSAGHSGGTAPAKTEGLDALIERLIPSGSWWWRIEGDEHFWSPGCFHLLGLADGEAPSYGRLLRAVHPTDRPKMPRLADLLRGEPIPPQVVQVIRGDGTTRFVSAAFETKVDFDGRLHCACGVLIDVTDREWLARSRAEAIGRRRRLDVQAGILRFMMRRDRSFEFVAEAEEVLGRPLSDINADPFAVVCPGESAAVHALISSHEATGSGLVRDIAPDRPDTPTGDVLLVMVPACGESGAWDGLLQVRVRHGSNEGDAVERLLRSGDFVAARALLGWSRQELAEASRLSLSTVRRLEDGQEASAGRSRTRIVEALRRGGVRFQLTFDGSVAMSRRHARPDGGEARWRRAP